MKRYLLAIIVGCIVGLLFSFLFSWKVYDVVASTKLHNGMSISESSSFIASPYFYGPFLSNSALLFMASCISSLAIVYFMRKD